MALDFNEFKKRMRKVFDDGKKATSSNQVADAIAKAIHEYLTTAEVSGVTTDVVDINQQKIGTGTQTGSVHLK